MGDDCEINNEFIVVKTGFAPGLGGGDTHEVLTADETAGYSF